MPTHAQVCQEQDRSPAEETPTVSPFHATRVPKTVAGHGSSDAHQRGARQLQHCVVCVEHANWGFSGTRSLLREVSS